MGILQAVERQKSSNHHAREERRKGFVPGNLYGKNINNILFEIGNLELEEEMSKRGENGIINITINGGNHKALIKEIQKDSVNHKIMHVDLEELSDDTVCVSEVPLLFSGENYVMKKGGILQKSKSKIKIKCSADKLPKNIEVNVSGMNIGDTFRISDIEVADEITLLDEIDSIVAGLVKSNGADIPDDNVENEAENEK